MEKEEFWGPQRYRYTASGLAILGIISPGLVYLYRKLVFSEFPELDKLAGVGDWLGGVSSPILSLAGFMMILAAYLSQREELRLGRETLINQTEELALSREALEAQKEELQLTRQEMEETRKEFIEQTITMKKQRFENTFFKLLDFQNEIIQTLIFTNGDTYVGRSIFLHVNSVLTGDHYNRARESNDINLQLDHEAEIIVMIEAYSTFWTSRQSEISHYFGSLTNIIKFISFTLNNEDERILYMNFIKSLLSPRELIAIYYYINFGPGYKNLHGLVKEYDLLENMDKDLIERKHRVIDPTLLHNAWQYWERTCKEKMKDNMKNLNN